MNCECDHKKSEHTQKDGCMFRYPPGAEEEYQDNLGYCICTEFYRIEK